MLSLAAVYEHVLLLHKIEIERPSSDCRECFSKSETLSKQTITLRIPATIVNSHAIETEGKKGLKHHAKQINSLLTTLRVQDTRTSASFASFALAVPEREQSVGRPCGSCRNAAALLAVW